MQGMGPPDSRPECAVRVTVASQLTCGLVQRRDSPAGVRAHVQHVAEQREPGRGRQLRQRDEARARVDRVLEGRLLVFSQRALSIHPASS